MIDGSEGGDTEQNMFVNISKRKIQISGMRLTLNSLRLLFFFFLLLFFLKKKQVQVRTVILLCVMLCNHVVFSNG